LPAFVENLSRLLIFSESVVTSTTSALDDDQVQICQWSSVLVLKGSCIPGMQGWFNIHESLSVIQHINRSKVKNQLNISIDAKKKNPFNTILHYFMIKALMKVRIE
jgi:hypothetical protein